MLIGDLIERLGDLPIYTADSQLLENLTGYNLHRGVLCAMQRRALPSVEEVCQKARRVAVLEGIVDPTNVGAIFRSAAALNMDAVLVLVLGAGGMPEQWVKALKKLETGCGLFVVNLGTGKGYSVLDMLHAFEKACGKELAYVIDPRRPGDIAECWADPAKAKAELGWEAQFDLEDMCRDSWNWQSQNPDGYPK